MDTDGNIFFRIESKDAGKKKTATLTISSEENKVTEKVTVTIDAEGRISLKLVKEKKQKK